MAIDWRFISELEGGQALEGYVPEPEASNSGVTIATGVDLGQMTEEAIDALPVPNALQDKLIPYAELKKQIAVDFLKQHSLTITQEEADALDRAVKGKTVATVRRRYDEAVRGNADLRAFDELSNEAQTVICSVTFQYGPDLARRTPRFWGACAGQRWADVAAELRNFGDAYPTRRNKEADFLGDSI